MSDDLTFDDLATGDAVALGRARYRADHGDQHAADLLDRVDLAYRHAAQHDQQASDELRRAWDKVHSTSPPDGAA